METRIPPTLQFGVITPEDAVRVFRQRNLLSPTYNWQELWQDAHARAFTVSRLARLDLLAAVRNAVDDAIDNGASLREFQARLRPLLADAGWWGTREVIDPRTGEVLRTTFGPTRLQLIYETNLRQSFAAGRWQRVQRNKSVLPYLRYRTARDERVRPAHAAWEGVTLPVDHPWWQTHYPPNGWRCFPSGTPVAAAPWRWRTIESIRVGDLVLGGSGKLKAVAAVHARPYDGELVRLVCKGAQIAATPNHRVLTLAGWKSAGRLQRGDILIQIVQAPCGNDPVVHVDRAHAALGNGDVALPVQRQPPVGEALHGQAERGHEHVDEILVDPGVVLADKAARLQAVDDGAHGGGGFGVALHVRLWVEQMQQATAARELLAYLRSACAGGLRQVRRHTRNAWGVVLALAASAVKTAVGPIDTHGAQFLRRGGAAGVGVLPLSEYSFASDARRDAEVPHQLDERLDLHPPARADFAVTHPLLDVEGEQGFAGGAPLDRFDSLESFQGWAKRHAQLHEVLDVRREVYSGTVYNLTVADDETYVLPTGVVHNCRCRAYAVSAAAIDRARARGERVITTAPADGSYQVRNTATGEVLTVPAGVDPGFGYNAGIAAGAALQDARAAALARAPADLAAAHVAAEDRLAQAWIARYARDAVRSGQVERWREQAARYGFAADALTDAEQRMLVAYTQSGAGSLNQYARGDWPVNSVEIVQGFEAAAATLDRALAKMPATDAAVISRLDLPPAVLLRLQPGAVWTRPDYTSASYAPTVAGEAELYKERPVRLLIQGRSGRVIDWGSPSQFEREVLFPRGTRFVVVAREEVGAETHITLREVQ